MNLIKEALKVWKKVNGNALTHLKQITTPEQKRVMEKGKAVQKRKQY